MGKKVIIFKVALADDKQVWRRIAVRENQTLDDLHEAIFDDFGRDDEHMYSFYFPRPGAKGRKLLKDAKEYTHPYIADGGDPFTTFMRGKPPGNAAKTRLSSLNLEPKQKFQYLFDFGDEWWHEITVEQADVVAENGTYPQILERHGDSPPQHPDWDEEEDEYDDRDEEDMEFERKASELADRFENSFAVKNLPQEQRKHAWFLADLLFRHAWISEDISPEEFDCDFLRETLLETFPGDIAADPDFFECLAPLTQILLGWMETENILDDSAPLVKAVGQWEKDIVANAADTSRWSSIKMVAMAAKAEDVDLSDPAQLKQFAQKVKQRLAKLGRDEYGDRDDEDDDWDEDDDFDDDFDDEEYSEIVERYKRMRQAGIKLNKILPNYFSNKILKRAANKFGMWHKDTLVMDDADRDSPILMDYAIHDCYEDDENAVDRYAAKHPPAAGSDEEAALEAMSRAFYALVEVKKTIPGVGARVYDMLSGQRFLLVDISLSETVSADAMIAARIFPFEDFATTSGAALPVGHEALVKINQLLRTYISNDTQDVLAELSRQRRTELSGEIIRICLGEKSGARIAYKSFDDSLEKSCYDEDNGYYEPVEPIVNESDKIGRNSPCPCGSGKKYKKCCGH